MRRANARRARLQAFRDLSEAMSTLAERLFDEALAVSDDENDAAFAASCALMNELDRCSVRARTLSSSTARRQSRDCSSGQT